MRLILAMSMLMGLSTVAQAETIFHCNDRYGDMFFSDARIDKTDESIRFEMTTYLRDEDDQIETGIREDHPLFNIDGNPIVKLVAEGDPRKFDNICTQKNGLVYCRLNPTTITLHFADGTEQEHSAWNTWFEFHELTKRSFSGTTSRRIVAEFYGSIDGQSLHPELGFRYHRCNR